MNFVIIALIVALLWGIQPLVQKELLKNFSYHSVFMFVNIIFTTCLVIYGYVYREIILDDFKKLESNHIHLLLFSAIICGFLASITYYHLLKDHKSYVITTITYTAPIFTILLSEYFLKESINPYSKIGVLFVVMGVFLMAYYNN